MKRKFYKEQFCEITDELYNPARGWYQIFSFYIEQKPDLQTAESCLNAKETIVRLLFDIGVYRQCELDETAIEHIEEILSFFSEHQKDMILRIAYDTVGKGMERDPAFFDTVRMHLKQLERPLQRFRQHIILFEGMLVGSWGEMHSSKFLSRKHMLQMHEVLDQSAGGIFRAVRRPVQWRMLHQADCLEAGETQTGLYNDGIFGSDDDLGTYGSESKETAGWESPWLPEDELEFESRLCDLVPQGGEVVYSKGHEVSSSLEQDTERLKKMRLSYLNCVYDSRLLSIWENWVWNENDVWQDVNGYDYIGRHLGYRFCVRDAQVKFLAGQCKLNLKIENTGYAGFYQEAQICLICVDETGRQLEFETDWDIREWKGGRITSLSWVISECRGMIYLSAKRRWDHRTIYFANRSIEQGWIPIGRLE